MLPFQELYRKIKGSLPSGQLWDTYLTILSINSAMQRTIVLPPNSPPAAIAALRDAIEELNHDPAYAQEADKTLGFAPEWVAVPEPMRRCAAHCRSRRRCARSSPITSRAERSSEVDMKRCCALLLALAACAAPALAQAQTWPTRPVRIVNTFAAGGAADLLARTVADGLSSAFGQPFIVETRAGAGGAIGVQSVMATPPDGYNFVITNVSILVLAPISNPRLGYAPLRDLVNIAYIAGSPIVLSVNPTSGIKTLAQFIAQAKTSGKPLTYSSSGVGSMGQLFAESFAQQAGIKIEHVPYKGASQGLLDLVGGHIAFASQTVTSTFGEISGGTLTAIAQTSDRRLPDFPDLPTFNELGYPDVASTMWFSLSGPAGLPADIVQKVNREINKTMARPEIEQRMRQEGMVTQALSPAEFLQLIEAETREVEAGDRAGGPDREVRGVRVCRASRDTGDALSRNLA